MIGSRPRTHNYFRRSRTDCGEVAERLRVRLQWNPSVSAFTWVRIPPSPSGSLLSLEVQLVEHYCRDEESPPVVPTSDGNNALEDQQSDQKQRDEDQ